MPKQIAISTLNDIQRILLEETIESFFSVMTHIMQTRKIPEILDILDDLHQVASNDEQSIAATNRVKKVLIDFHKLRDPIIVEFVFWMFRVLQFCLGRSGDLKLEKIGGYLTEEQEEDLRRRTADLLQQGILQMIELQALEEQPFPMTETMILRSRS